MKLFTLTIMLFSMLACTQKYQTYHLIDKNNFDKEKPTTPIGRKVFKGAKFKKEYCRGQILFMSNAKKETDRYVSNLVRYSCPTDDVLVESKITETWWTTLVYSRSCVELESHCPRKR